MTDSLSTRRIPYLDAVRVFAMVLVVLLHSSAPLMMNFSGSTLHRWIIVDIYHSLTRIGVPLFVMVSGALLLGKDHDGPFGLPAKNILRVFVPFVLWSAVYIVYGHFRYGEGITPTEIAIRLLLGPVYYHLWFIYMLLGLYLSVPVFRAFVKNASPSLMAYAISIWAGGVTLATMQPIWRQQIYFRLPLAGYIGYFLLGYLLNSTYDRRPVKYVIGLLGAYAATVIGSYYLIADGVPQKDNFFQIDTFPTIMLMSVCVFMLFKASDIKRNRFVEFLSGLVFGVYFIHALVIDVIVGRYKDINMTNRGVLAVFVAATVISFGAAAVYGLLSRKPRSR